MEELITSGIILTILYFLLVRGFIFRWVLWLGGFLYLGEKLDNIQILHNSPIVILDHKLDWAVILAAVITFLAIITTKIKARKINE